MKIIPQGTHSRVKHCSNSPIQDAAVGSVSFSAHGMLREHIVGASILLPGVGYMELAFVAMVERDALRLGVLTLVKVAFVRPCVVGSESDAPAQFKLRRVLSSTGSFVISSQSCGTDRTFTTHAMGEGATGIKRYNRTVGLSQPRMFKTRHLRAVANACLFAAQIRRAVSPS